MQIKLEKAYDKKNDKYYTVEDFEDNNDYKQRVGNDFLVCPECHEPKLTFSKNKIKGTKFFKTFPKLHHDEWCSFNLENTYTYTEMKEGIEKTNDYLRGEAEKVFNNILCNLSNPPTSPGHKSNFKVDSKSTVGKRRKNSGGVGSIKTMTRRKMENIKKTDKDSYCVVWGILKGSDVIFNNENAEYKNFRVKFSDSEVSIGISQKVMEYFTKEQKEFFEKNSDEIYFICFPTKVRYYEAGNIFNLTLYNSKEFFIKRMIK